MQKCSHIPEMLPSPGHSAHKAINAAAGRRSYLVDGEIVCGGVGVEAARRALRAAKRRRADQQLVQQHAEAPVVGGEAVALLGAQRAAHLLGRHELRHAHQRVGARGGTAEALRHAEVGELTTIEGSARRGGWGGVR